MTIMICVTDVLILNEMVLTTFFIDTGFLNFNQQLKCELKKLIIKLIQPSWSLGNTIFVMEGSGFEVEGLVNSHQATFLVPTERLTSEENK